MLRLCKYVCMSVIFLLLSSNSLWAQSIGAEKQASVFYQDKQFAPTYGQHEERLMAYSVTQRLQVWNG